MVNANKHLYALIWSERLLVWDSIATSQTKKIPFLMRGVMIAKSYELLTMAGIKNLKS